MHRLPILCRDLQKRTSPRAYQRLAGSMDQVQIVVMARCIRDVQYIRDQFRMIAEYLEEDELLEIKSREQSDERGKEFVQMYYDILRRKTREITRIKIAASFLCASINGSMEDRLDQCDHPAMYRRPICDIFDRPRGTKISHDEAYSRLIELSQDV